jgi:uncharacterized protein YjbI with pentapeptide repeats
LDVSFRDLTSYDLEGADLRDYRFSSSKLNNANLVAADLRGSDFTDASLNGADLRHAILGDATGFARATFVGANLSGLTFNETLRLAGTDFRGANLTATRFQNANLSGAIFASQTLSNISFRGSHLEGTDFSGSDLSGADLSRSKMVNTKFTGANISGVNMEGAEIYAVSMAGRDLRTVFLRGAHITHSDWSGINASGADLSLAQIEADPTDAPPPVWSGANFSGCNLEGLTIAGDDPRPTHTPTLTGLNFRNANLRGATLKQCIFRNTDFTGANLSLANFASSDLTGCTGFDPEKPGIQFSNTILPNGTIRSGMNPGSTVLVPGSVPSRLVFNINDGGISSTLELAFTPLIDSDPASDGTFSHGLGAPTQGTFRFNERSFNLIYSTLELHYAPQNGAQYQNYTLFFTSPSEGKLFRLIDGIFQIGSFYIP